MWWEKGQNRVLTDCSFSVRRRRRRTFGHFCVDLDSLKGAKCERRRRQPKLRIVCTKAAYDVIFSNSKGWGNCAAGSTFSGTYSASFYILCILREMTLDCCASIKHFKTAIVLCSPCLTRIGRCFLLDMNIDWSPSTGGCATEKFSSCFFSVRKSLRSASACADTLKFRSL